MSIASSELQTRSNGVAVKQASCPRITFIRQSFSTFQKIYQTILTERNSNTTHNVHHKELRSPLVTTRANPAMCPLSGTWPPVGPGELAARVAAPTINDTVEVGD
ncbi:hypothetical protein L204_104155 [Cryptococcus depauperatus]